MAATNLCSPSLIVNLDTSVTTKTASTSQPQPLVAIHDPKRRHRGARQSERRDLRRAFSVGASTVSHTREQHREHGAEEVPLLLDLH